MSCRAATLVALSLSFVLAAPSFAAPPVVEVTTCGQIVSGRNAVLTADLVCSTGAGSFGVQLRSGAKLDLQGHTITGGSVGVACGTMLCVDSWCGPTKRSGSCQVSNGTITGAEYAIGARQIVVRDMTFVDNHGGDILAVHKADIHGSQFQGTPSSVQGDKRVRLFDSTLDGGYVNSAKRVELHATTITNASTFGVQGRDIRLFGSSVTGSLDHLGCGTEFDCADLLSDTPPLVDATSTCERSRRTRRGPTAPLESWGVCALD